MREVCFKVPLIFMGFFSAGAFCDGISLDTLNLSLEASSYPKKFVANWNYSYTPIWYYDPEGHEYDTVDTSLPNSRCRIALTLKSEDASYAATSYMDCGSFLTGPSNGEATAAGSTSSLSIPYKGLKYRISAVLEASNVSSNTLTSNSISVPYDPPSYINPIDSVGTSVKISWLPGFANKVTSTLWYEVHVSGKDANLTDLISGTTWYAPIIPAPGENYVFSIKSVNISDASLNSKEKTASFSGPNAPTPDPDPVPEDPAPNDPAPNDPGSNTPGLNNNHDNSNTPDGNNTPQNAVFFGKGCSIETIPTS